MQEADLSPAVTFSIELLLKHHLRSQKVVSKSNYPFPNCFRQTSIISCRVISSSTMEGQHLTLTGLFQIGNYQFYSNSPPSLFPRYCSDFIPGHCRHSLKVNAASPSLSPSSVSLSHKGPHSLPLPCCHPPWHQEMFCFMSGTTSLNYGKACRHEEDHQNKILSQANEKGNVWSATSFWFDLLHFGKWKLEVRIQMDIKFTCSLS